MRRPYRLNLTRIDFNNTNSRGDELLSQGVGEGADSGLGGAVDAAARVRLAAGNTANVDNITTATLRALLEYGQDGLGHVNETGDVGVKHDLDILGSDFRCLGDTLDQTTAPRMSVSIININQFSLICMTHALLTRTSISLNSSGREETKLLISSGLLTSSLTGRTWTPSPTSCVISAATSFNVSMRRAVRINFRFLGDVRANSLAVLFPMPDEAPVTTIVLPSRRFATAEAMVRRIEVRRAVRGKEEFVERAGDVKGCESR